MHTFTLEEETRRGYTISKEMKKVWAVELELLYKLLEVCEKYHLRIWADGGTLLGTVREKGFIPWDDDIDMVMLRDDYDKLVSLAKEEFKSPYFFQCGYTDKFPFGFSKLRKDGTSAILAHEYNIYEHQGIFIDIFPYDAVPDEEGEMLNQRDNVLRSLGDLKSFYSHYYSFTDFNHNLRTRRAIKSIKRKGFQKTFVDYENLFRAYKIEDCKNVSCISFHYNFDRFLRDKHWYDKTLHMPFENISMPVPVGYDEILKLEYGNDYMTPIMISSLHGGFFILKADIPYEQVLHTIKRKHRFDIWKNRRKVFCQKILQICNIGKKV